jgi:hypothetical protein
VYRRDIPTAATLAWHHTEYGETSDSGSDVSEPERRQHLSDDRPGTRLDYPRRDLQGGSATRVGKSRVKGFTLYERRIRKMERLNMVIDGTKEQQDQIVVAMKQGKEVSLFDKQSKTFVVMSRKG